MSRQRKLRNKRIAQVRYTHEIDHDKDGKEIIGPRRKGPQLPWGKPGTSNLRRGA